VSGATAPARRRALIEIIELEVRAEDASASACRPSASTSRLAPLPRLTSSGVAASAVWGPSNVKAFAPGGVRVLPGCSFGLLQGECASL